MQDQEDLDREQPSSIKDVFDTVPGVQTVGSTSRPLGLAFNIRGIGNTEQPASESRIIVTVDGIPKFYEQYRMGAFFTTSNFTSGSRCCAVQRRAPSTGQARSGVSSISPPKMRRIS
ncbi:MAG: TonB-dependent receptor plug domain-containing protein [Rhodobacteraceae bacterium]|nr:TonB-dependent receptor plug domain-containing protein [Paracoccaceae bacterium]